MVIYLVMGMLYESFIHPVTILSGLPSAGVGALFMLALFKSELNLYSMVGLIMLIGIVKKNAIMMIDFALDAERSGGKPPKEAIYEASLVRFRPIMMTTMRTARRVADRARLGCRGGVPQAVGSCGGRRASRLSGADALLHPGVLHLSGQTPLQRSQRSDQSLGDDGFEKHSGAECSRPHTKQHRTRYD